MSVVHKMLNPDNYYKPLSRFLHLEDDEMAVRFLSVPRALASKRSIITDVIFWGVNDNSGISVSNENKPHTFSKRHTAMTLKNAIHLA